MAINAQSKTRHLIKSIEGIYRRLDAQQGGYGRNATATHLTLFRRWDELTAVLENGGYEELDANAGLARRFATIERRRAGILA